MKPVFTRGAPCVFLLFALYASVSIMSAQPTITKGANVGGVSLILSGAPEFDALLTSALHGQSRAPLNPVLQYSVIVKNNTTRAIRGTGVLYTSDFGLGRTYDDLNAIVNLPPMPILLQPGAIRFDCILPGVGNAVQSGRLAEFSQRRSFQERMQFHISRDLLMKGIKVSLDFVLFDDGSFIGPDKLRRFQWMMRGTSAEQEFVKSLGAMRGQSDASVGAFLQNEANAAEPEHRAPVVDIDPTVHRQKQLAKQFLIAFRSAGSNAVFTALDSYIAQHPQFNIHRGNDQ